MQQFTDERHHVLRAENLRTGGLYQHHRANVGTVIVGLTNVLATFIAIGLVDRWGRKPTLTLGFR